MKSIIRFFAKKYLRNIINDSLKSIQDRHDIQRYIKNISRINDFLSILLGAFEDMNISDDEIQIILERFNELFDKTGESK